MKKITLLFTLLFIGNGLLAQNITYDLRWNETNSNYEFYVTRDISAIAPVTTGGPSRVTIVFPTDGVSGTRTVSHTNETVVATYSDGGIIRSPGASPTNDYYVFSATGGSSYIGILNAGVEVLWMTFTASDGNQNARLFVNDSDPNSSDSGMSGINARQEFNVITISGGADEYSGNLLGTKDYQITSLKVLPNPTKGLFSIKGQIETLKSVEVYNIVGQLVKHINNQFSQINIESLESGVYFVKLNAENASRTIKLIKN
ncbi:MAG: hypothetical protein DA407_00270 [Bacteroidetes bacterium]|nr:MAG: hypothetical protein DA407_00270 [Bacteroidota bacterium]